MTAKSDIARLKISLDDVKPQVVRRIEVPLGIRLDRLHAVLQVAIGWTNSHLWEFRAGGSGWGVPDPDGGFGDEPHDAKKATLFGVLEDTGARSIGYLYDFGDGWEHTIKIERIVDAEPGALYPRLGVPFLGEIPLHMDIRETSDLGTPVTATAPDSPHAGLYRAIAERCWIALESGAGAKAAPRIVME